MSTALAIAATSRVIAAVIDDAVAAARLILPGGILGSATTTSSPPDHILTGADDEVTNLNLFLYHVTYNQGWREVGLPTRNGNGSVVDRSPLAVDLHYLLSAYSAGDYEAQVMLGVGMQALHEIPILFRQKIRDVFSAPSTDIDKALATADLADQIEMVKITPQQLTTEELSKLWTAFPSKFRVSAAYAVSVLLIETKAAVEAALPVLTRTVTVFPFTEPTIDAIDPPRLPFSATASLTISGQNLPGRNTVVVFDANPGAPQTPALRNGGAEMSVNLPSLLAGLNTLRVVRQIGLGVTPLTTVVESNVGSFVLQPVVKRDPAPPHDYLITVGAPDSSVPPHVPVTAKIDPPVTAAQRASLLLNELGAAPGVVPLSYSFDAAAVDITPPDTIVFTTQGVASGRQYLARVRIDGADSPLDIDTTTKQFVTPAVPF